LNDCDDLDNGLNHILTSVVRGDNQYETDLNQERENEESEYVMTIKRLKKVTMETLTVGY